MLTCKKICRTIQTANEITRVRDEKEYGQWFNLYSLIKLCDSCQPDQSIEPYVAATSINENKDEETKVEEYNEKNGSNTFLPTRKSSSRKRKCDCVAEVLQETVNVPKTAVETDPSQETLTLMREDVRQAREQDIKFHQLMAAMCQQPSLN